MFRKTVVGTLILTLILVMMGAWVRLTDAGLGCPDWPGCYGKLTPLGAKQDIAKAVIEQGGEHGPVSMGKAWREMVHRYLATFVGFLILVMAIWSVVKRNTDSASRRQQGWILPVVLLFVVIWQGLFGMWTVTLDLMPIIVTIHLLGGMLTLSLLAWLANRQYAKPQYLDNEPVAKLRGLAVWSLIVVAAQIFLGGWTSTNYAALACHDLPLCQGQLLPPTDFKTGFTLLRELGVDPAGDPITFPALTAIHLVHRLGAIIVTIVVGLLAWRTIRAGEVTLGRAVGAALLLQLILGLANIVFSLPLWLAVAHNGGAALLCMLLVTLNYRVYHAQLRV